VQEATPSGHWDAVLAEVTRLQYEQHRSPLAALQAVHAKVASGWLPPARPLNASSSQTVSGTRS
jgi:hypothetical protein